MFPDLQAATRNYWRKLDQLEATYQRGEVSLAEVDVRVAELMAELGQVRRAALSAVWGQLKHQWQTQREAIVGVVLLVGLTYAWFVVSHSA
jgi:hypothetical protein